MAEYLEILSIGKDGDDWVAEVRISSTWSRLMSFILGRDLSERLLIVQPKWQAFWMVPETGQDPFSESDRWWMHRALKQKQRHCEFLESQRQPKAAGAGT